MELVLVCVLGKFGFFRPDLDGNKLATGMSLARTARDRVFIYFTRVINYCFE